MSMPDNRGITGRDGSARATKATASPSASRPTVNFLSTILALATDISERKAFANPGHLRKARSRQPGGRGSSRGLDRAGQVARGLRGKFHRRPGQPSVRGADEVEGHGGMGSGEG